MIYELPQWNRVARSFYSFYDGMLENYFGIIENRLRFIVTTFWVLFRFIFIEPLVLLRAGRNNKITTKWKEIFSTVELMIIGSGIYIVSCPRVRTHTHTSTDTLSVKIITADSIAVGSSTLYKAITVGIDE